MSVKPLTMMVGQGVTRGVKVMNVTTASLISLYCIVVKGMKEQWWPTDGDVGLRERPQAHRSMFMHIAIVSFLINFT
jgi:hypothetical protein